MGITSGVAGLLLWPIVGAVILIGVVLWLIKRGIQGSHPAFGSQH